MSKLPAAELTEQLHPDDPTFNDIYAQSMARYRFADRVLAGKAKILEIGSGMGTGTHRFSLPSYRRVLGVDADPESVAFAAERYAHPRLRFLHDAAPDLSRIEGTFDGIVCLEAIEHVVADGALVRWVSEHLADGGVFVLSTPNRLITSPDTERPVNPYHVREYSPDQLRALLGAEFTGVRIFGQRLRYDRRRLLAPLVEGLSARLDAVEGRVDEVWVRYVELLGSKLRPIAAAVAWARGLGAGRSIFAGREARERSARRERSAAFYRRLLPFVTAKSSDWEFEPKEYSRAPALLAICERASGDVGREGAPS